jgi:hypothetical protein
MHVEMIRGVFVVTIFFILRRYKRASMKPFYNKRDAGKPVNILKPV